MTESAKVVVSKLSKVIEQSVLGTILLIFVVGGGWIINKQATKFLDIREREVKVLEGLLENVSERLLKLEQQRP